MPHDHWSGAVGRAARYHGPNSPEVAAAREALRTERARQKVREVVDLAPPLDPAVRAELAALLLAPAQDVAS